MVLTLDGDKDALKLISMPKSLILRMFFVNCHFKRAVLVFFFSSKCAADVYQVLEKNVIFCIY